MKLKVLASGSSGNCYILSTQTGSLVLEAGIPWKKIQAGLNFDLSGVVGCLVSHAHKDHSRAIVDVMKAGIDVLASVGTVEELNIGNWAVNSYRLSFAEAGVQSVVDDFIVLPFDTEHDCREPLGYLIQYRPTKEKLLFLTDSYYCKYQFRGLHTIMIECNYIKETLDANIETGYINEASKPRLLESHFSHEHVKQFLKANDLSQCRKIVLLHLSSLNSDAARMVREITELTSIETVVAEQGLEVELEMCPY